jgi:hypothetical protein
MTTSSSRGVLVNRRTRQASGAACWRAQRADGPAPRQGAVAWLRRLLEKKCCVR